MKVTLSGPVIIEEYNEHMGGVDKANMLLSLYKTKNRTKKWYHRIFFHLLNVAIMNSWILHRSTGGEGVILDFVLDVERCLMTGDA